MRGWSIFYFRDPKAVDDIPKPGQSRVYIEVIPSGINKLTHLKRRVQKRGYASYVVCVTGGLVFITPRSHVRVVSFPTPISLHSLYLGLPAATRLGFRLICGRVEGG